MPELAYLHPNARYSKAVSANGMTFLSAVYALVPHQTAAGQTHEVLSTIDTYLADLGAGRDQIVKATVFIADPQDFTAINEIWDAWVVEGCAPARTPIFGPLLRPDAKVGIEIVVAQP